MCLHSLVCFQLQRCAYTATTHHTHILCIILIHRESSVSETGELGVVALGTEFWSASTRVHFRQVDYARWYFGRMVVIDKGRAALARISVLNSSGEK